MLSAGSVRPYTPTARSAHQLQLRFPVFFLDLYSKLPQSRFPAEKWQQHNINHPKQACRRLTLRRVSHSGIYSRRQLTASLQESGICAVLQKKLLPPPPQHCSYPAVFPAITSWKSDSVCVCFGLREQRGLNVVRANPYHHSSTHTHTPCSFAF